MKTCFGVLCDKVGSAWTRELARGANGAPQLRMKTWATPSTAVCPVQDRILVDRCHDHRIVGEVAALHRDRGGRLWAVAHVSDDVEPTVHVRVGSDLVAVAEPMFWSLERVGDPDHGYTIQWASIVPRTARVAPGAPLQWLDGALDYRSVAVDRWHLPSGFTRDLLTRSANAYLDRREHGGPIVIESDDIGSAFSPGGILPRHVEIRSATAVDVHRSRRELDVLIAPAGVPTTIREPGRSYVESFSHGCFAGAERNPQAVKVNVAHERERVVGRAIHLDPFDPGGLVGTLKLSRTTVADDLLELAADDLIGVSAGFAIEPGGDEWRDRSHRRIRRAVLDHVALTADPAYPAAKVVGVRSRLATTGA